MNKKHYGFVFVVVLLFVHLDAKDRERFENATSHVFYLQDHSHFKGIFDEFKNTIADTHDEDEIIKGYPNPVLKPQHLNEVPFKWFLIMLYGFELDRTEFAVRNDNLYMSGFTNGNGQWFRFSDVPEYVLPDSIPLNFSSQYKDLVGDGTSKDAWEKLKGLKIDRRSTNWAIGVARNYDPNITPVEDIKLALTTLIVVFIESQRFPYIRELVYKAWLNDDNVEENQEVKLDIKGAELVVNWKRMSCAVRIWDASGREVWDSKEAKDLMESGLKIGSPEEAMGTIWFILQSDRCPK